MNLPEGVRRLFRLDRGIRDVRCDVEEELRFHFDAKVEALEASGLSADAARAEAVRQFGSVRETRDALLRADRDRERGRARAGSWESWLLDLRQALRSVRRAPGLTVAIVVMLGLGIGAASAMYGLLDRLLLRVPPHVERPDELRRLYIHEFSSFSQSLSYRAWYSARELSDFRTVLPDSMSITATMAAADALDGDEHDRVRVLYTSGESFGVIGVRPVRGRLLEPEDDRPGSEPAAVVSEGFARKRFATVDRALGQSVTLSGITYTVVGVTPRGFSWLRPDRIDIWIPLSIGLASRREGFQWQDHMFTLDAVVRVPPGVPPAPLALAVQRAYRARVQGGERGDSTGRALLVPVAPIHRPGAPSETTRLSVIVAGVAVLLCAIAVANATNLLLLRALRRRRDTAIRLALGVSRWRLVRGVVLEGMLIALAGAAVAGIAAGWGGEILRALVVHAEWQLPLLDVRVLVFAGAVGLVLGVVTGLVPGLQASREDAVAALKCGAGAGAGRSRLRPLLVGLQAACTVVLLAGLALYTRSFQRAAAFDYGFAIDRLVVADLPAPMQRRDTSGAQAAVASELAERVAALPGVRSVSQVSIAPLRGWGWAGLRVEGIGAVNPGRNGPFITEVDDEFAATTGLPVVRGRGFEPTEIGAASPVAMVSESFADRFWPGQDPLGRCIWVGQPGEPGADVCRRIIGVLGDFRRNLGEAESQQAYYVPLGYRWQTDRTGHTLIVRSALQPRAILPDVQRVVRERLPEAPLSGILALRDGPDRDLEPWRAGTRLFGLFGSLALVLALGGLYSVVAHSVAQRRPEFGLRVALGARAAHLVGLVLAIALRPAAIGIAIGLAVTLWLARYLAPLLYNTPARDPWSMAAAAIVLLATALLAALLPARSAATADPRQALQAD